MLGAASTIYGWGLAGRQSAALGRRKRLPAFVISVGNLVAGGTGKTPFTLLLAETLRERGLRPAVLSRGYGRTSRDVARVPTEGDTRSLVPLFGDEPVLMARKAPFVPIWVGRERIRAGWEAIRTSRANVLIMDDGFQHVSLERDLDLVLLDASHPFGNGRLLPAGPLREPISSLNRADAFILTRADTAHCTTRTRDHLARLFPEKPAFACRHRLERFHMALNADEIPLSLLRETPTLAFAGIARPESFFQGLRALGIPLRAAVPLPDHKYPSATDLLSLLHQCKKAGARVLITTEKDWVRLPADLQPFVATAELRLEYPSGVAESLFDLVEGAFR